MVAESPGGTVRAFPEERNVAVAYPWPELITPQGAMGEGGGGGRASPGGQEGEGSVGYAERGRFKRIFHPTIF